MLIINCKNYPEVAGAGLGRLYAAAERASKEYGVRIAIAPPPHLIGTVKSRLIYTLSQHVDDKEPGGTTGYVVPELLKKARVHGSIINHSEHRIGISMIKSLVPRLRQLNMISVLCVRSVAEARKLAPLKPDYMAIEPPSLIGSGRAVSKERPGLISSAALAVNAPTRLLCGAGIVSGQDVARARELGAAGILVASGVIRARSWTRSISELARSM